MTDRERESAAAARLDAVLDLASEFARSLATTPEQREVVDVALRGFDGAESRESLRKTVDTPLLVYAALTGEERRAWPLAAGSALNVLGARIIDEIEDRELADYWCSVSPQELYLIAIGLTCVWPQLIIQRLDVSAERRLAMSERLVLGLTRMAAGQQLDMRLRDALVVSTADAERATIGKSGEEYATTVGLTAMLADVSNERVELCAQLGLAIGTAFQASSDCYDIFMTDASRDLKNGTRTMPLALELSRLSGKDRDDFAALLDRAKIDSGVLPEIRGRLVESGALRGCAIMVETYCQKARRLLREIEPLEPAARELETIVNGITFFPT